MIRSLFCLALVSMALSCASGATFDLGAVGPGARAEAFTSGTEQSWGIRVQTGGTNALVQIEPARIGIFDNAGHRTDLVSAYTDGTTSGSTFVGTATLTAPSGGAFHIEDTWSVSDGHLRVARQLKVFGNAPGGFASAILFDTASTHSLAGLQYFAPGSMYGAPEHVIATAAGGIDAYEAGALEIREDMLPAPLFGFSCGDGYSAAVLEPAPRGNNTVADCAKPQMQQVDARFQYGGFGAGGAAAGAVQWGYWFPGTHGFLVDNDAMTSPMKFRRYHPIRDGFTQEYKLEWRFGREETFHEFMKKSWRWAWGRMQPKIYHHDIDQVRRSVIDMLAEQVETHDGRTGLPNSINQSRNPRTRDPKAIMGFTGKCIESAVFLIMDAARGESPLDEEHRRKGLALIDSFLKLQVAPPEAEGFDMVTGKLMLALPRDKVVYLRSFTDAMKSLLHGYEFEKKHGYDHPEWLVWCREFADWLLTQQSATGGFPRAWEPGTGKVADPAEQSSFNAISLLVQLREITGDQRYLEAARRAAEMCWVFEQVHDHYLGGTIDNPNIIDKEAATISMEGYLDLYRITGEQRWLNRAVAAADFAETFTYTWNVPMPDDATEEYLHWGKGVPTIGLNVCSTSRPGLGGQYMAFEVDELARLYKLTGDHHFLELATMFLHNSHHMLALPGRTFDFPGPGWASEHIALGPPHRGRGMNFLWLPWVATCRLNGIFYMEQLDPQLFEQMKKAGQ